MLVLSSFVIRNRQLHQIGWRAFQVFQCSWIIYPTGELVVTWKSERMPIKLAGTRPSPFHLTPNINLIFFFFFNWFFFLQRERKGERKREREEHQFVVPLIYAFMGCPDRGSNPLVYQDDAVTKWATQPGLLWLFLTVTSLSMFSNSKFIPFSIFF